MVKHIIEELFPQYFIRHLFRSLPTRSRYITWQSSRMARASDSATFVHFRTNKLNQLKEVQEISKLNIEVLYSSSLDISSGPSKNSDKFVVRIENSQILQLQVISGRTNHIESDLLKFID